MENNEMFLPNPERMIELLGKKIARLECENVALISQSENLMAFIEQMAAEEEDLPQE